MNYASHASTPVIKKNCIRPNSNELLTIRSASSERVVTIHDNNGVLDLACVFVSSTTGNELYVRNLHAIGTFTLYGVMCNRFPNKRYLVQWTPRLQRYGCSCKEGRQYGSCMHIAEVEEYTTREVVNA